MLMRTIQRIALALTIIGALNWGLIGFFNFDLVAAIFGGQDAAFSRIIYSLVGLSGIVCLTLLFKVWEERETVEPTNHQGYGKVNYGTEFGEESDITEVRDITSRNDKDQQE